jgi:hypothetical protein
MRHSRKIKNQKTMKNKNMICTAQKGLTKRSTNALRAGLRFARRCAWRYAKLGTIHDR